MSAHSQSTSSLRSQENPVAPRTLTAFLRGNRIGTDSSNSDLDAAEAAVDIHYAELCRLLDTDTNLFWKEVACTSSLHQFVDSYLKVRDRSCRTHIAGGLTRRDDLERQLLLFLHRLSSNTGDYIDSEQHAALLQEKNWLDLPKLIEISFLFPIGNAQLVGELVENAIKSQPNVLEEIGIALSYFLSRVGTFYHKCMASFEVLASSPGDEAIIKDQPRKDLLEIEEFIVDAVVMLNCFIQTYKPAAFLFSLPSQISNQTEDLLNLLGRMHDTLFPIFKLEFPRLYEYLHLNSLCDKIVELGRNILVICYLTTDAIGENFGSQPITKLFPAMVDDPATRGDIVFHTLVRVNKEILPCIHHVEGHITFLKSIELKCSLLSRIRILSERGWLFLDDEQFSYLSEIMMPPSIKPGFFEE